MQKAIGGIESMHWVLDVNFREDDSLHTRADSGQQPERWLRRFAVTLLKAPILTKDSLRGKDDVLYAQHRYLTEVLLP